MEICSFRTSLYLFLSKDGVPENAAQGVRSTTPRKGVKRGKGGILGCGWEMCERTPKVRFPPGEFSGAIVILFHMTYRRNHLRV